MKKLLLASSILFFLFGCGELGSSSSYDPDYEITRWMSNYDGSIFEFEYDVKKLLDDPESFEHVETSYTKSAKVKMKFRAKNRFGAIVLNTAHADLNTIDGTVSNIRIE